jgi:pentatricopeptide repeat domain-containing protein 3
VEFTEDSKASSGHKGHESLEGNLLVPARDKYAVLKALSSTVEKLAHPLVMGRSPADPLAPRSRQEQMEFIMAMMAGEKAAKHFIHRYPKLFEGRNPEPDWRVKKKMKGCREETLQFLIEKRRVQKAMKMYKALQEKGDPVSIEVQNNLLRLLSHYGMGNPWRSTGGHKETVEKKGPEQEDIESEGVSDDLELSLSEPLLEDAEINTQESQKEQGQQGEGQEEEVVRLRMDEKAHFKGKVNTQPKMERIWSSDNMAEKFFSEMESKNGGTYDAMIPGLVKFKDYDRAFEMYTTLRSNGFQASRTAYHFLLEAILASNQRSMWKRARDLVKSMEESPVVIPTTNTFNLLLEIAWKSASSAKQSSLEIMEEMLFIGTKPNLTTFTLLLQCHLASSDVAILYDIVTYLEKNREFLVVDDPRDIHFFPVAISVARYLKDYELGRRLKELAEQDNWYLTQNIGYFLNHYLVLLSLAPNLDLLMTEYRRIVPFLHVPREWVYIDLIGACEDKQLPDVAIELFDDMRRRRIRITDIKVFKRLFSALSVKLNLERLPEYSAAVERITKAMHYTGIRPTEFMITQMIRISALGDNVEKAM